MFTLCASVNAVNTGGVNCDKSMGKLKYLLKTDKEFSSSDYASATAFIAALRAAGLLARNDGNKLFTFPLLLDLQDNSTQNTTGSLGDGPVEVLQEGAPGFTGGFKANSRQVQNLRSLANASAGRYLCVDENNVIWGYKTSADKFIGIKLDVFVSSDRFRAQGAVKGQVISISASDPSEFAQSRYIAMPSTFVATDYGVLLDVQLYSKVAPSSNVFKVDGLVQTSEVKNSQSAYTNFGAALVAACWYAKNVATGAAITITSVAVDAVNLCYTVTLDSTTWSGLSSGAVVEIGWNAPTVLDANNVTGVEGLSYTVIK